MTLDVAGEVADLEHQFGDERQPRAALGSQRRFAIGTRTVGGRDDRRRTMD